MSPLGVCISSPVNCGGGGGCELDDFYGSLAFASYGFLSTDTSLESKGWMETSCYTTPNAKQLIMEFQQSALPRWCLPPCLPALLAFLEISVQNNTSVPD